MITRLRDRRQPQANRWVAEINAEAAAAAEHEGPFPMYGWSVNQGNPCIDWKPPASRRYRACECGAELTRRHAAQGCRNP